MKNKPNISLEQWLAFKTVVDEGSFAKAAEALNKSQSTISYAIAKLEEQLPTAVLKITGRKAGLTDEGKVLYRRATQLLQLAEEIEQTAECLSQGWEAEIIINGDCIVSVLPILQAIHEFSLEAPQTRITLLETSLSGTTQVLLEGKSDITLSSQTPPGFLGTPLTTVKMIPVAHANHALCLLNRELTDQDLKQHRQIIVRDSGTKRNLDAGWLGAEQRLTVSHFAHSIQAINHGLGFAFVPDWLVDKYLQTGNLKRLPLVMQAERNIPVYLILARPDSLGPATQLISKLLVKHFR